MLKSRCSTSLLEDIAVDTFFVSAFGTFVMGLFPGLFTTPSWQSFSLLACGWALASGQHTITTYLGVTGATRVKHFSSFYAFLGGPLYQARWQLWACLIQRAATWVAACEPIVLEGDDSTKKKSGRHIAGAAPYRNGAGTARQEYRSLWGLNFVWVIMRLPLSCWPGHRLSVPVGLSLYLQEPQATRLKLPYRSRSALAREIIDFVANPTVWVRPSGPSRWWLCHQGMPAGLAQKCRRGFPPAGHGQPLRAAQISKAFQARPATKQRPGARLTSDVGPQAPGLARPPY